MTAAMKVVGIPYIEPVAAFAPFAGDAFAALLDSAAADARGRYSYIVAEPRRIVVADDDGVRVDGAAVAGDPFTVLERELGARRTHDAALPAPFAGGAVGFVGYEAGRHLERLPAPAADPLGMPEMAVGIYDAVIAFDVHARRAWVMGEAAAADRLAARVAGAAETLPEPDMAARAEWRTEQTRGQAEAAIARTIDYIAAGDIFQANITQRVLAEAPAGLDDFTLYRRLRGLSPAPFAAMVKCGRDYTLMSASPERFLSLDAAGNVETRPIKGTRARDADPARDAALAAELQASVKDNAENLMIVDVLRNDLGRVCEIGSVNVPVLCGIETFASVHHLVSVVRGRLKPGTGPVGLLRACFPGGSITGAPKIRAMEIIRELEPSRRGAYCGSILWIGFDGAMDSSIVIRTLVRASGTLIAQGGGGIVADSDPAAEYDEAMLKMRPLMRAGRGEAT